VTKITFLSDSDRIAGNLFAAQNPKEIAFLFIQGWTGNQNVLTAQALAQLGYTSMTYDMRGNKESEGDLTKLSRADFINDATIAYDYLQSQVGDSIAIGVVGSSFGAYTATLLSKERRIKCLSLRVPATYPDADFSEPELPQISSIELTAWRKEVTDYTQNKAMGALHDFKGYVQIIEAEKDEVIPHQATLNYANAVADSSKLQHDLMHDAPHRLATEELQTEYVQLVIEWVAKIQSN